ncbi:TPA: small-conductance mechanosensitive channel MscS [Proteus mirabilis]|uniref:small-conductance mechanosensitive channel MscS n=1 Tax=Proteus mirabilis TaxID=584 RepID=UPI0018C735C3|nr:small-conductance mechanosensitive channel MscS [Proteus mirabilis]HEJ9412229.1 small-conductance mechanosensitive channel MscS [Proteus mirabilis]HEJ9437279.1 small-conductance mechanosensitive channel MscS [Proteus mirabilis]HEK1718627.1 small-conductance mechanosensitive channel MscS [Proteus mirabilis]HEK2724129.1 small-conductance mechanosensitive channel MscS [Proteus mirabilis]
MNELPASLDEATGWFVANQELLIQYAVNIIAAIVILIVGMIVAKAVSKGISRVLSLRKIDSTVVNFLSTIVRYAIIMFTLIAVLGRLGVQTASIVAVLGAAGLAVAFALRDSLGNFASGVLLVVFRPLKVGEYVILGAVEGTVQDVQIFSTTLRSADDRIIVIPNGKVLSGEIINLTREPNRRTQIMVGVAYDADIDKVKQVLGDVIAKDNRIQHEQGVTIRLQEMAPSSLDFVVRVWTSNSDALAVYWDLMENFKRALDANNIGIPFPQMDVYMHQAQKTEIKTE